MGTYFESHGFASLNSLFMPWSWCLIFIVALLFAVLFVFTRSKSLTFIDGRFIARNRLFQIWRVDQQQIVSIVKNAKLQQITLKTDDAEFVITLSRLSHRSSCALAELATMQLALSKASCNDGIEA